MVAQNKEIPEGEVGWKIDERVVMGSMDELLLEGCMNRGIGTCV